MTLTNLLTLLLQRAHIHQNMASSMRMRVNQNEYTNLGLSQNAVVLFLQKHCFSVVFFLSTTLPSLRSSPCSRSRRTHACLYGATDYLHSTCPRRPSPRPTGRRRGGGPPDKVDATCYRSFTAFFLLTLVNISRVGRPRYYKPWPNFTPTRTDETPRPPHL